MKPVSADTHVKVTTMIVRGPNKILILWYCGFKNLNYSHAAEMVDIMI